MKRHLQCAEQQVSPSNLTKYRACHTEWLACLIVVTYETSFTMRGATGVTIQPYQILRLPRKMTRLLYRPHIWNVIYNARSNRCHHPTSPNTAPATQNDSTALSSSHMKRHLHCAEQQVSRFNLTKYCACQEKWHCKMSKKISKNRVKRHFQCGADPTMIRPWSEHDPTMIRPWKRKPQPASQVRLLCEVPRSIFYCKIQRFAPNLTFKPSPNTAPATKSDNWTSPSTAPATKSDTWTSPSTAPATKSDTWTSPNTAPATKKWLDCCIVLTYETSFPMRGATGVTIQPPQVLHLPRKMTLQDVKENLQKQVKRHFQCGADPTMIREWSEHDPRMIRAWKRKPQPASQVRLLFELTTSIFYWKIQRFAPNLTFKPSPNTAPATKSDTWTSPSTAPATKSDTWTSPSSAPATKSDTWTSPNTAPATKNDSTAVSSSHMKRHFQCAEQQVSLSNLPKYCTCHEKWHCKMSKKISKNRWNVISNAGPIRPWSENDPSMIREWSEHENANRNPPRKWGYFSSSPRAFSIEKYNVSRPILHSNLHQILRLPPKVPLELHQILRLPRKVTLELHQVVRLPRKVTLELHQVLRLPRKVTLELHQVLHLPRKVTLELHQVLRLPLYCNWTLLYSTLLDTTLLDSTLLDTILLDSTLLNTILLDSTLLDRPTLLLYSTWLYSTWLYSTWLYSTWLYSTWLYSTWPTLLDLLYLILLYLTLLYLTLLYLTLFYLTLLYLTDLLYYSTLLDSTLLDSTLLDSTLLDSTLLDSTLLDSTLLDLLYLTYSTWFYSTWPTLLDSILLDTTLLDSTLLDTTLRDTILLDSTLLDSTLLDSTLRDTILLDSTLLDSTLLDTILLDSTLLDSTLLNTTLLDLTLLRCRSYIGSFWAKLPLTSKNAVFLPIRNFPPLANPQQGPLPGPET